MKNNFFKSIFIVLVVSSIFTSCEPISSPTYSNEVSSYIPSNEKNNDDNNNVDLTKSVVLFLNYDDSTFKRIEIPRNTLVAIPSEIPSKEGYTFKSWNYDFTSKVNKDVLKINPLFEINKYTITFKNCNGDILSTEKVNYDSKVTKPTEPTYNEKHKDYKFKYWTLNDEEYNFNNNIKSDITLIAKYDPIIYVMCELRKSNPITNNIILVRMCYDWSNENTTYVTPIKGVVDIFVNSNKIDYSRKSAQTVSFEGSDGTNIKIKINEIDGYSFVYIDYKRLDRIDMDLISMDTTLPFVRR